MKTPGFALKVISLFVVVGLLGAVMPFQMASGQSSSRTFKANADAHVIKSSPNTNFGSKTYLTIDASPTTWNYLRFNVSGLNGARITSARLRVYGLYGSSTGFNVVKISNNSWSESSVTYNTAPTLGSTVRKSGSFSANRWIDLDVTGAVSGEGQITFALTTTTESAMSVASRERESGTYAPQLVVALGTTAPTTTAPTRTPTKAPTLAPTTAATGAPTATRPAPTATRIAPTLAPTSTRPAPTATPSGQPLPLGVAGNWKLTWSDEFNGSQLDLNKWEPNWLAGNDTAITKPINGSEQSCYDPSQVSVANGSLKLSAVARSCRATNGTTYSYASGIVTSRPHYTFSYGYMEARVWLDGSSTIKNWPAFWADGTGTWPTTGEIDVMEGLGGRPSWHYHWGTTSNHQSAGGYPTMTSKVGWHTFAADWAPGSIKFYYDGVYAGQVTQGVVSNPMFLILNYGVSTSISPPIQVPSNFLVDYVRVWQRVP